MLVPAEGQGTEDEPMAGLMAEAKRLQARPGVLAVSLFPVQPWLDIPDTGFSVMAVADGPRRAAEIEPMLRQLAWQAWERRRSFAADLLTVDEAIRRALDAEGGPFILSESADSTGSGSPGDGAHVLERLLALGVQARCLVTVVDAPAVARAIAAGVGADVSTTVGGTLDPRYNRPVPISGARPDPLRRPLRLVRQEDRWGSSSRWGGRRSSRSAASPCWRPSGPRSPSTPRSTARSASSRGTRRSSSVKSPLQFRDGYGGFARACWVVDTPGPSTARVERLDWHQRARPLFPFEDDFEPEIRAVLGPGRGGSRAPPVTDAPRAPVPIFRWSGALWGFVDHDRLYDRHGRQAGWVEAVPGRGPDVFDLERALPRRAVRPPLRDAPRARAEPVHRAPRVRAIHPAPPDPVPARDPRTPLDDWTDPLPWPLAPPDPPAR